LLYHARNAVLLATTQIGELVQPIVVKFGTQPPSVGPCQWRWWRYRVEPAVGSRAEPL